MDRIIKSFTDKDDVTFTLSQVCGVSNDYRLGCKYTHPSCAGKQCESAINITELLKVPAVSVWTGPLNLIKLLDILENDDEREAVIIKVQSFYDVISIVIKKELIMSPLQSVNPDSVKAFVSIMTEPL